MKNCDWKKRTHFFGVILLVISIVLPFGGFEVSASSITNNQRTTNLQLEQDLLQPNNGETSNTTKTSTTESGQRVIVTFKNKADKSHFNGKTSRGYKHFSKAMSVTLTAKEIEQLKKDPDIQSIEPDILLTSTSQSIDWGVSVVEATYAWDRGVTGKGVKVAILDTGIDTHHEDLSVAGGTSFVPYATSFDDDNGHGTHVAGIIGAKNNDIGVVGVAPDASLYSVKVLDATGKGYVSDIIAGIDWAVENKMDIVNMSMATSVDSPALHTAVDKAYQSGLLVVASAGNVGADGGTSGNIQYPAKYSSVIGVGAVDQNNQRTVFSAIGSELEVVAPGVGINSTYKDNSYKTMSGTSMSSAFIAGELALLKQSDLSLTNIELRGELNRKVNFVEDPNPSGVTESVYSNMNGEELGLSASVGPSVQKRDCLLDSCGIFNVTSSFPSLVNAKSITYNYEASRGHEYFVLYNDNTVKKRTCVSTSCGITDATSSFPSLVNAKSIAYNYEASRGHEYFVLYNDNTVKKRTCVSTSCGITDATSSFPSLVNAKSIAYNYEASRWHEYFVLYNDNTVKKRTCVSSECGTTVATSSFPSLVNAKSIAYNYEASSGPVSEYYVAYLDQNPTLTLSSTSNQIAYKNGSGNTFTLSGTIYDYDNDNVTITAAVGGVSKSTTISNTSTAKPWTLQWNAQTDNIPIGAYSNIAVSANDGLWGNASVTYNGTIVVDNVPNAPSGLNPGSNSISTPALIAGTTPTLKWLFTDPDAGDTQGAYQVQIYNAAGTTLIHDSGWVNSAASTFTVPSGKLVRGTIYSWRVAVKDNKQGVSSFSPLSYIKTNSLPTLNVTSYTNGQQIPDNILTFTWQYADSDGQAQSKIQIQGSKDGWATIGYDSGVISSNASSFSTAPIPDGTWSFKVTVNDGLEWSNAATRTSLIIPNTYEPNDTSALAFRINYNTEYSSVISSATDVDYFKYVAPATGIDVVTLTVPVGVNYDLYLYDANMKYVVAGVNNEASVKEDLILRVTAGNTYYIKVVGVNGAFNAAPFTLKVSPYATTQQTQYEYDANGNIKKKTTTLLY